jgi:hypothetical protein
MPVQLSKVPELFLEAFLHFINTKEVGRGMVNLEPGHGIRHHYFADVTVMSEPGEGGADMTMFNNQEFWRKKRLGRG